MIKNYSGHIIGLLVAISFFMLLAYIVKPSSDSLKTENSFRVVDFIRLKKDTSLKEKSRTIPDKPEPPKKPPPPDLITPELQAPPQAPNLNIEFPDISVPTDFKGAFLGEISSLTSGTSQLIPIVKVTPRCPREAAIAGINGSVLMILNVNASGKVDRVVIKQAKPPGIFNKEASRAVRRWQFKPKTVDGVAVDQEGELLVEFVCNV